MASEIVGEALADASGSLVIRSWRAFRTSDRFSLTTGSIICLLLTGWLSHVLNVPAMPGRAGVLLQQPAWPIAIGVAWLSIFIGSAAAAIVASRVHYEGSLFCACVGLGYLSVRSGPMRFALFEASGRQILISMSIELVLLGVAIAAAWTMMHRLSQSGLLPHEPVSEKDDEPLDQKLLALAAQVLLTAILVLLFCQSDDKHQTLAGVALASYLGALGAHHFVMTRPSVWFWVGPLIVGVIGYLAAAVTVSDWVIGDLDGFFAALARPMPLDYASLGTAGALLGYWTSQRWHEARALGEVAEP